MTRQPAVPPRVAAGTVAGPVRHCSQPAGAVGRIFCNPGAGLLLK